MVVPYDRDIENMDITDKEYYKLEEKEKSMYKPKLVFSFRTELLIKKDYKHLAFNDIQIYYPLNGVVIEENKELDTLIIQTKCKNLEEVRIKMTSDTIIEMTKSHSLNVMIVSLLFDKKLSGRRID